MCIVKTMLEAIIAFMPIKEDHDAIGSIDCSKDMRKNFATMSQNFKCDICGNISDILKPRVVVKDKKEEDVTSKQDEDGKDNNDNNKVNDNKDNVKDDNKDSMNDDNKESNEELAASLKDIITSFNKDKVNETNINDNTLRLNTLDDIINTKHHQPSVQINKNINNNPTTDFLSDDTNKLPNQSTTTNINTQTTQTINNTPNLPSQTQTQPTPHKQQHIPPFYDEFLEEFSYYKIQNTIKCHYTKSKEEIDTEIKHLQTHPQPPLKPIPTSHPSPSPMTTPYTSPFKPFPSIETPPVDPPSDLETKIKQRIYFNKFLTREKYDKIKKEKLRNLNITMMIVMISIILLYYIITKFIY